MLRHILARASASLPLLIVTAPPFQALAETKCEVNTGPCVDARTGETRVCSTTTCKNEKGEVVSITTIVLKDGGVQGGTGSKSKVPLRDLNVTKQIDKASPN